jgi:hypothetical protein
MRARALKGFARGMECVVVVKHTLPEGTPLLGWELVSDVAHRNGT